MSELLEKQFRLTRYMPLLFSHAHSLGFEITLGDSMRDERVFGKWGEQKGYGHPKSNHKRRLAFDINLFKLDSQGEYYFIQDTETFRPLGEFWESLDADTRWGGRFDDGNHFSIFHDGIM